MGYIDAEQLGRLAHPLAKTRYGEYLLQILHDRSRP
jgi:dTDP-glucose pyrophosphorylase